MRWRFRIASLAFASLLSLQQTAVAGGDATGDTTIGNDGTDSNIETSGTKGGPENPGNSAPKPRPPSNCPQFELQPNSPTFHMRRPNGGYYLMALARCRAGDQYSPTPIRCISECPANDDIPDIPPPPNADGVLRNLLSAALPPVPRFAPPVERPDVEAITGLRLYFSVDPAMWTPITPPTQTAPGGWWATATLTPTDISLTFNGMKATCDGPGANPKTETGRAKSAAAGCYLAITTIPEGGTAPAELTITWTAVIQSNVPGVPATGLINTTTITPVRVKELQAVITK